MSTIDYGRNDSITFIKSQIPQVFNDDKIKVHNNKLMTGLCGAEPKPGMFNYESLISFMPNAIKTDPVYSQPENCVVVPPRKTDISAKTINTTSVETPKATTSPIATPKAPSNSTWDVNPSSISTPVAPAKVEADKLDIPLNADISAKAAPKSTESNLDTDPKKVAKELKEQEMHEAMKKEDLSFLKSA